MPEAYAKDGSFLSFFFLFFFEKRLDISYGLAAHVGITWTVAEEQTVVFGDPQVVVPRYDVYASTAS